MVEFVAKLATRGTGRQTREPLCRRHRPKAVHEPGSMVRFANRCCDCSTRMKRVRERRPVTVVAGVSRFLNKLTMSRSCGGGVDAHSHARLDCETATKLDAAWSNCPDGGAMKCDRLRTQCGRSLQAEGEKLVASTESGVGVWELKRLRELFG